MDCVTQDSPGREESPITTRCGGDVEVKGDAGLDPQLATGTRLKEIVGFAILILQQLLVQKPTQSRDTGKLYFQVSLSPVTISYLQSSLVQIKQFA